MNLKPGDWAIIVDHGLHSFQLAPHLFGLVVLITNVTTPYKGSFPIHCTGPQGQNWTFREMDLRPATDVNRLAFKLGAKL